MKSFTAIALASSLCAIAVAGCRVNSPAQAENRQQAPSLPVAVASAHQQTLIRSVEGQGALFPREKAMIAAEVSGKVVKIQADMGDKVQTGTVLLRIDPKEYQLKADSAAAALAQADARLENARAEFSRADKLREQKLVSQAQYDQLSAAMKMARADVEAADKALALAKKKLDDADVKAPFDGYVQRRVASMGQMVNTAEPLYELVAVDPIKLRTPVPERYVPLARIGLKVELSVAANPDKIYTGEITRIAPALDDASRTLLVEAEVPNPDGLLKPGYFAHTKVSFGEDHGLFIPQNAVVRFAGVERVFVVDGGIAHSRQVATGALEGDQIEIIKGLAEGEQVAVSDTDRLADNVRVTPVADTRHSATASAAQSEKPGTAGQAASKL